MLECFPKLKSLGGNVKVELDLSNYTTKANSKNATGVDTSYFVKKTDLANLKSDVYRLDIDKITNIPSGLKLKSEVDKWDIGKLETTPVDLSKLSDVVKNEVVKKTEFNESFKKVNNINTTDTSDLVKKKLATAQKVIRLKIKLLITIMINIQKLENLNKLTWENFTARLKEANLAIKNYISDFVKETDFDDKLKNLNKKVASNKTKYVLVEIELNEQKKLKQYQQKG